MARGSHSWAHKSCDVYADYWGWLRLQRGRNVRTEHYVDYANRDTYICGQMFGHCPNDRTCPFYREGVIRLAKLMVDSLIQEG